MIVDRRGAKNPNAVLTSALVAEMKRLHAAGFGYGYVAKWIGVSKSCVQKVLTKRTWTRRRATLSR